MQDGAEDHVGTNFSLLSGEKPGDSTEDQQNKKCICKDIFIGTYERDLKSSGPQPFWPQGWVSWKAIIPHKGEGRVREDGLGMIHIQHVCCALYF